MEMGNVSKRLQPGHRADNKPNLKWVSNAAKNCHTRRCSSAGPLTKIVTSSVIYRNEVIEMISTQFYH